MRGEELYVPPSDTCLVVCRDQYIVLSNMMHLLLDLYYLVPIPVQTNFCITLPFRLVISPSLCNVSRVLGMPMIWLVYWQSVCPCVKY